MSIINISESWTEKKTLTKSGQYYDLAKKVEYRDGGAGLGGGAQFPGDGTCILSGHMNRLYFHYENYNAILTCDYVPHYKSGGLEDDISMRLRMRHDIPASSPNPLDNRWDRIGGIGWNVRQTHHIPVREQYHNSYKNKRSKSLSQDIVSERTYHLKLSVQDESSTTVRNKGWINGHLEMDDLQKPEKAFFDKQKIMNHSHCHLRFNGDGAMTIYNVVLEVLS